jgi:hypothetical protein
MRLDRLTRIAGAFAAPLLLCGCPNPNTYTTPRTLDPGKVQWQIAPEAIGVNYNQTVNGTTQSASAILPMVPTFGARVGMVDGFDMGFRLTNLDSASVDGKIRLVKSQFDVALDPGLQGFYVSANGTAAGVLYMHLPVLLGLNLSENVSIVASPGVVYAVVTSTTNSGSGVQGAATASGLFGRLGVGMDFRTSKTFAIHPEITFMRQFSDIDALIYVFGIGFNIGAQPDYSDLAAGATGDGSGGGGAAPPASAAPASPPPASSAQ